MTQQTPSDPSPAPLLLSVPAIFAQVCQITLFQGGGFVRLTFQEVLDDSMTTRSAVVLPVEVVKQMGEVITTMLAEQPEGRPN